MSSINKSFVIPIAVATAACLVSAAAFAQTAGPASTAARNDIQRTADLVNLMRTVLDPNPATVLASPAERAVSGRTASDPASHIAATVPVVIMPDIEVPEEDAEKPDDPAAKKEKPAQPSEADASREKNADEADPDMDPPLYYMLFYGDYVPYYSGWYYYSDRWLWGRRWPAPPEPPGWIPPPPPPRPLIPVRPAESGSSTIPVVPSRHRVPRGNR